MTLPEVCPRDGASQCKKADCHLYVTDWRSGDEQCIIGYGSTHKKMSGPSPVMDTYAERTRLNRETKRRQPVSREPQARVFQETGTSGAVQTAPAPPETMPAEPVSSEAKPRSKPEPVVQDAHVKENICEKVVSSDKDTTLIESGQNTDVSQQSRKKGKSIDDVMNLDLPDNYEEEFWK